MTVCIELDSTPLADAEKKFQEDGHSQLEWIHVLTGALLGHLAAIGKDDAIPRILIALIAADVFANASDLRAMMPSNLN